MIAFVLIVVLVAHLRLVDREHAARQERMTDANRAMGWAIEVSVDDLDAGDADDTDAATDPTVARAE